MSAYIRPKKFLDIKTSNQGSPALVYTDLVKRKLHEPKPEEASDPSGSRLDLVKDDAHWMRAALSEAEQAGIDVPVGAVVVRDGELLASGFNQREATGDPTAHAEIVALRGAALALGTWRLSGATIYTTLEPCPMCAEAIIQARLSRLVFGAYDSASGAAGSAFNLFVPGRIFPIPEVIGGIAEQQCQDLLLAFFRSRPDR